MSSICPKCKFLLTCDVLYKDSIIECEDFKDNRNNQKTNADRLRSMSDEQLAIWIAETSNCSDWCILIEQCKTKPDYECCVNVWLKWLKEELEGNE